jgi:hypothetical protein
MRCKQNTLLVGALNNLQLLFNSLQPIIGVHWFNRVRERRRLGLLEFSKLVALLRLWCWLISLRLLHICHSLLHGLQDLTLRGQNLLQCWWWRQVGIVVVIILLSSTVACVGHLMIVKIFETEIEIKDSQLYSSRYNDD